jgi:hypothetical protein
MPAILPDYLADVGRDMAAKSAAIRRDFATHRLSAGENREDVRWRWALAGHHPQSELARSSAEEVNKWHMCDIL